MPDNKAEIIIAAKDLAKKELDNVTKEVKGMSDKSSGHVRKLASDFAGLARSAVNAAAKIAAIGAGVTFAALLTGLYALKKVMEDVTALSVVQENAEARLGVVLKATGNAAGYNLDQLKKIASQMQNITTFGDEAILSGMSKLATFKSISGDIFKRTTMAALDMSVVMEQDVKSSMIQLGKAINDPITGLSALQRVGVSFTEQQKDQIKHLVETNHLMEAQKLILEELESEFGGAASKGLSPFSFAIGQLKNSWGDLKEEIGFNITKNEAIIALIEKAKKKVEEWIPALKQWREEHKVIIAQKFEEYLQKIIAKGKELRDWFVTNREDIRFWADIARQSFQAVWDIVKKVADAIFQLGKTIGETAAKVVDFYEKTAAKASSYYNKFKSNQFAWDDSTGAAKISDISGPPTAIPIDANRYEIEYVFTGTGSSKMMLSEKIAELQGKLGKFAGYVGGLEPGLNIDTSAVTSGLERINSQFESTLQNMISYIAQSQLDLENVSQVGSRSSLYPEYQRALRLQVEAGYGQINDLIRRTSIEADITRNLLGGVSDRLTAEQYQSLLQRQGLAGSGGSTSIVGSSAFDRMIAGSGNKYAGINITLPEYTGVSTGQDWRDITRNYIIPELQSAGF